MCYGSYLLGPLSAAQTHEFALRARVLSPLEVLRSATLNPARMMGRGECIGQVKQGFLTDLVVLGRNPLEVVTVFDRPECVLGIFKDGRVCKSRWEALPENSEIPVRV